MTAVQESVSHLRENPYEIAQAPASQGRERVQHRRQPRQRARQVQEGGRRLGSRDDGRRDDRGLRRLPRHPQRRARPVEGRDPLPPGRHARRGAGAGDVDDLEVRPDGDSLRRRQGRRQLRPEEALPARAGGHDPALHERDHQRDRPREGHPGPRRRHQPARDGLDLRHLLDEQGPLRPRGRHRQAADRRRLARPARGDRPRRPLLHARRARPARPRRRGPDRRRPGLRQRRQLLRALHAAGGREGDRRLGLGRRACTTRRGSTSPRRSRTSRSAER